MKAPRVTLVASLALGLGLLGCAREDDGTDSMKKVREVPTPSVPDDYGSGSRTGPQPTDPDQAYPGNAPDEGHAND